MGRRPEKKFEDVGFFAAPKDIFKNRLKTQWGHFHNIMILNRILIIEIEGKTLEFEDVGKFRLSQRSSNLLKIKYKYNIRMLRKKQPKKRCITSKFEGHLQIFRVYMRTNRYDSSSRQIAGVLPGSESYK